MKCDNCFFCTHIGKGVLWDHPAKFCKKTKNYMFPVVIENGVKRELDFNKMSDCKIWHNIGCKIHPQTVEKAKRNFLKLLISEETT